MAGTVEDCVRSHVAWISAKADAGSGARGRQGDVDWAWVPVDRTMHLLFPTDPMAADVRAIVDVADGFGATATAMWSAVEERRDGLVDVGFEEGWQPWWMSAAPGDVPTPRTDRAEVVTAVRDHDRGMAGLAARSDVVLAEAHDRGHHAGRAWLHLDGDVAGVYDMAVWPPFRRRGLGRDLLGTIVREGARRGARVVTLNATPDGAALYGSCGFQRLGEGRTWWRHRPTGTASPR